MCDCNRRASMIAELKILRDVASYRLRRLEMANLGGAFAIMVAVHLTTVEIAVRLAFGLALNLLVYLNNDWHDRDEDVDAMGRERDKTRFLRAHPAEAVRWWLTAFLHLAESSRRSRVRALGLQIPDQADPLLLHSGRFLQVYFQQLSCPVYVCQDNLLAEVEAGFARA